MRNWFSDAASLRAELVALRDGEHRHTLTFRELIAAAKTAPLPASGTVCTQLPGSVDHVLILLGAVAGGRPFCPINPRLPLARAVELARLVGAASLLTEAGPIELGKPRSVDLASSESVIFTSGSSGEPKPVVIPLAAHLASARGAATRIPLGPGDSWALDLPLHHVSGLSILFRCIDAGAAIHLQGSKTPATHRSMVATQLKRHLASGRGWAGLKALLVGGEPISLDLANAAIASGCPLHLTYGLTETASQVTTTTRLDQPLTRVHAGSPLPRRRLAIGPQNRIAVGGEVLARGVLQPDGGVKPLAEAREQGTDSDGLYITGDIGRLDPEGNLVVEGRADRMFISGGENIHPEEIERELLALKSVQAAVVIPREDAEFGHRPVAFVLGSVKAPALREALSQVLPSFKVPDEILAWPAPLPPPFGKVQRETLDCLAAIVSESRRQ